LAGNSRVKFRFVDTDVGLIDHQDHHRPQE
jgi:hypothetical protein